MTQDTSPAFDWQKEAKKYGWQKIINGGWVVDNNFVSNDFVEKHVKRINSMMDELTQLHIQKNNVINEVVDIIQNNTPGLKDNNEWREGIFKLLQEKHQ